MVPRRAGDGGEHGVADRDAFGRQGCVVVDVPVLGLLRVEERERVRAAAVLGREVVISPAGPLLTDFSTRQCCAPNAATCGE